MQTPDALSEKFHLGDNLRFEQGNGGLLKAMLRSAGGATAEIYAHGAHVTSWATPSTGELLYLSPSAVFAPGKSIRGGIPLVFPQFGPGALPSHGFARSSVWSFDSARKDGANVIVSLTLESSAETRKLWDHEFRATYTVTLGASLSASLRVENSGVTAFSFQSALHTYFRVGDIGQVAVRGLQGGLYLDNLTGRQVGIESTQPLAVKSEIDRVYLRSPQKLEITDEKLHRSIRIETSGFPDAVVWNPWSEKEKGFSDLPAGGHREFICVESALFGAPVRLPSGESHTSMMTAIAVRS